MSHEVPEGGWKNVKDPYLKARVEEAAPFWHGLKIPETPVAQWKRQSTPEMQEGQSGHGVPMLARVRQAIISVLPEVEPLEIMTISYSGGVENIGNNA
jgi:hypothetical protein